MCLLVGPVACPLSSIAKVLWLSWSIIAGSHCNPWLSKIFCTLITGVAPSLTATSSVSAEDLVFMVCFTDIACMHPYVRGSLHESQGRNRCSRIFSQGKLCPSLSTVVYRVYCWYMLIGDPVCTSPVRWRSELLMPAWMLLRGTQVWFSLRYSWCSLLLNGIHLPFFLSRADDASLMTNRSASAGLTAVPLVPVFSSRLSIWFFMVTINLSGCV